MSRFFIDRPIFAWVIAIIIMMAGIFAMFGLPIEQYPEIAPTQVSVNANYPGASPEAIEQSVTQVIEQAMKGIDHLVYLSGSSSQGSGSVSLTFETGTNPDIAQVQVQNKLQQALRSLPQPVQAQGVNVVKSTGGWVLVLAFYVEDGNMTRTEISDYVATVVGDAVGRINGVGSANVFGSQNAMRIWLDPYKLNQYKLMPSDVRTAILAQNAQIATGRLGDLPAIQGQPITATITAQGRLRTPQQFRDIVLRVNEDGSSVTINDVARIEVGSESYDTIGWVDGKPSVGMGVQLASGANALQTAEAVLNRVTELEKFFPTGLKWVSSVDNAQFIRSSIEEVVVTLAEAIALVVLIMYLFLGSWRATLIPAIAVPVVLLGTFGVLYAFGYSINTLTLFAMVLAIGLLVDDAIVVVENVERLMHEEQLSPLEATRKSMDQITGALLGIALVLAAVFVPMAFFGGSTGAIYRQFSITIASAMALSVLVALVLTPALCATLLKAPDSEVHGRRRGLLTLFFRWFNERLQKATLYYQKTVGRLLGHLGRGFAVYALLVMAVGGLLWWLPTSFLPDEDQGNVNVSVQLPPGSTQERTNTVLAQMASLLESEKGAYRHVMTISGRGMFGSPSQATGQAWVRLKSWDDRTSDQSAQALLNRLPRTLSGIRDADFMVRNPPAIRGLGNTSGFSLELQDLGGAGYEGLTQARDQFLKLAAASPVLSQVRAQGTDIEPEYRINVDLNKAAALGLDLGDINDTLSSALGGSYVNDFINKGRVKKVYMQADAPYRMQPGDLEGWYVRNRNDEMVPLASITSGEWAVGPPRLQRYNGVSSLSINGVPTEGYSSGDAMAEVEKLMTQMPAGIGYDWSGVSYQERLAGSQAPLLYAVSVVFVFLCLAALYESWSIPFSVMLVVPLGVLGALLATALRGLENDVYFQVGLITTIGLSAKNAILIVEFATKLMEEGHGLIEATLRAVRIRLRPILMTSLAFMLGVLPLMLGTGAGAAGRHAIGTGVFGGMLTATVLGLLFVPLFFLFVEKYFVRARPETAAPATPTT